MTHRILFLTMLFLVPVLSGCSYRNDFVVINNSDRAIEVHYKIKGHTPKTPVALNAPAKLALKEFEKSEYKWQELPKDQYEFDNLTGTFRVSVAPDEVLLVDYAYNYTGEEDRFDIESIRIDGVRGSMDLKGREAQTQFKVEGTKYILRYR